ncbi:hypothetical protein BCR39DRAFT_586703 [Naematelia encephala]|uniref:Uncharacterized protein n=1 Tax=Naematelia encephala TaxID=71784 RepID=A0A1Y2BGE3_9TREE|nr:hypothetical protein BCR39DRAFT_586703 [Naematelia encephala]
MASTNPDNDHHSRSSTHQFWCDLGALVDSICSSGHDDSMHSADGIGETARTANLEAEGNGDNDGYATDADERPEDDDDGYYAAKALHSMDTATHNSADGVTDMANGDAGMETAAVDGADNDASVQTVTETWDTGPMETTTVTMVSGVPLNFCVTVAL